MPMVGAVNGNLCYFRPARTWRNNVIYGSGHSGAWLVWNSRRI